MAMERREDSLLTSPDVTPFGRPQLRQSVMVIRRKMKSIQASDILYFSHPTGVKGKIQRVRCWRGNPCQECVGKADEQACPPFQCTLAFRACCPCFLISFCLCSPFDTEVHLALNTLCFHFLSCSCLSVNVFHFMFFAFIEVFQVPPVASWPTASSLVLSFSAISYSGNKPQRMTLQRLGEKKAQRIPAWKYSGRLSRLAHFSGCHS